MFVCSYLISTFTISWWTFAIVTFATFFSTSLTYKYQNEQFNKTIAKDLYSLLWLHWQFELHVHLPVFVQSSVHEHLPAKRRKKARKYILCHKEKIIIIYLHIGKALLIVWNCKFIRWYIQRETTVFIVVEKIIVRSKKGGASSQFYRMTKSSSFQKNSALDNLTRYRKKERNQITSKFYCIPFDNVLLFIFKVIILTRRRKTKINNHYFFLKK